MVHGRLLVHGLRAERGRLLVHGLRAERGLLLGRGLRAERVLLLGHDHLLGHDRLVGRVLRAERVLRAPVHRYPTCLRLPREKRSQNYSSLEWPLKVRVCASIALWEYPLIPLIL